MREASADCFAHPVLRRCALERTRSFFSRVRGGSLRVLLLCGLAGTTSACASSGRAWMQQDPLSAVWTAADEEEQNLRVRQRPELAETAYGWEEEAPPARPRLTQVVTLGESWIVQEPSAEVGEPGGPSAHAEANAHAQANAQTQVIVVNQGWGYGMPGPGSPVWRSPARGAGRSVQPAPRAPLVPGKDWPQVQDHGPRFPFSSAPAQPWR